MGSVRAVRARAVVRRRRVGMVFWRDRDGEMCWKMGTAQCDDRKVGLFLMYALTNFGVFLKCITLISRRLALVVVKRVQDVLFAVPES